MNIDKFKNAIGGGVRPSLFRVRGNIGTTTSPDVLVSWSLPHNFLHQLLVKSTVNYRGRQIKLPGSEPLKTGRSLS